MWVTRNKDNKLKLFKSIKKPIRCGRDSYFDIKSDYYWWFDNDGQGTYFDLDSSLFPDLTWEDEPIEVSIVNTEYLNNLETIMNMYEEEHCSVDLNKLDNRLENTLNNTSKEMYENLVDKLNDMTDEDKEKEWEDLKSYNDYDLPINETVDEILKDEMYSK